MAEVENTDPRLADVVAAMVIADIDFKENEGNPRLAPDLADKCREAQYNFRAKKAELEGRPLVAA